jgi:tetratricopeptide (TPR) repeat protein
MIRLQFIAAAAVLVGLAFVSTAAASPADDGNAGLQALSDGDYKRAVMLFTRALNSGALARDDKEFAYSQRGIAYLKEGNATAAIADLRRALQIKPDDQDAQSALQEAQSQSGGSTSRAQAGGSSARPEQDAQAGMEALNGGDYSRAIPLFTRAINSGKLSSDDNELALVSRGKAYVGRGDYSDAVSDLNRALHIKADDQEALQAFSQALGHMRFSGQVAALDGPTCSKNFSATGSVFKGKTYTGFAEYPGLPPPYAFAGTYAALSAYTPVPGMAWQVSAADLDAGTITASITFSDSGRAIALDARVEPAGGGSRITIRETVPGLLPTIDLKGSLCHVLADASKG